MCTTTGENWRLVGRHPNSRHDTPASESLPSLGRQDNQRVYNGQERGAASENKQQPGREQQPMLLDAKMVLVVTTTLVHLAVLSSGALFANWRIEDQVCYCRQRERPICYLGQEPPIGMGVYLRTQCPCFAKRSLLNCKVDVDSKRVGRTVRSCSVLAHKPPTIQSEKQDSSTEACVLPTQSFPGSYWGGRQLQSSLESCLNF